MEKVLINQIKNDIVIYGVVYGVDYSVAKKIYIDNLVKGYNALQEQKEKYADTLKKVVEKLNIVKTL